MKPRAAVSWTGGKDSYLALHRTAERFNVEPLDGGSGSLGAALLADGERVFRTSAKGKHPHVARVALAWKLLGAAYVLLRDGVCSNETIFATEEKSVSPGVILALRGPCPDGADNPYVPRARIEACRIARKMPLDKHARRFHRKMTTKTKANSLRVARRSPKQAGDRGNRRISTGSPLYDGKCRRTLQETRSPALQN